MNKKTKRIFVMALAVFMALLMLLGVILPFVASGAPTNSKIEALKSKQQQLADEKKAIQSEIASLKNSRDSAVAEKKALDKQIQIMEDEFETLNELITEYGSEIARLQEDLAVAEANEQQQYELYLQRLRAIDELGTGSYLSVLLQASSLSEMLALSEDVNALISYDKQLMAEMQATTEAIAENKAALEESKRELTESKIEQQQRQEELIAEYAVVEQRVKDIEADEAALQKIYNEKAAAEKELQDDIAKQLAELAKQETQYVGGAYLWPLPTGYRTITSAYGWRVHPITGKNSLHSGVDIAAPRNTPIYASNSGEVIRAEYNTAYGYMVMINHGGSKATLYGHMTRYIVSKGQKVSRGDIIGYVGSTGWSTGNHLHFEIHENGTTKNPMSFF